jgi:hypothetical protein
VPDFAILLEEAWLIKKSRPLMMPLGGHLLATAIQAVWLKKRLGTIADPQAKKDGYSIIR